MITLSALRVDAITCPNSNSVVSLKGGTYNTTFPSGSTQLEKICTRSGDKFKVFASRSSRRRLTKEQKTSKSGNLQDANSKDQEFTDEFTPREASYSDLSNISLDDKKPVPSPSRSAVLQACILTSGLMIALGAFIRQASHIAFTEGWVKLDSTEVSCAFTFFFLTILLVSYPVDFELWHLELITGLVILVSSCRYILLNTWPEFAESSEVANQQVLSSLELVDYMVVACLPGVSEELLFRGGLLPLFGLNWISALVVAAIFGLLHLGGGRKYSFAAWATFVGFAYGMATIISSSMIVPMASHSLSNLIGGILWRYQSTLREKSNS